MPEPHVITAVVEGQLVRDWQSGNIESSMTTPADKFVLRMPWSLRAYNTLRRDARITVFADGTPLLDGFIDKRKKDSKAGTIEIEGRDRVGRLCDESAPAINYTGMTILQAVELLARPWFSNVTLSDARNRRVRVGKGRRVASPVEPVVTINVRAPKRGNAHPGQSRWQLIHEIVSRAGLICYSSSDGKELFVGKPNVSQAPQYQFAWTIPGSTRQTNVGNLVFTEDDGERYSSILVAGAGGQSDTNYGINTVDNRGAVFDNPFNRIDGTGRDFIHPKRMFMPEQAFESYGDAQRVAQNEQFRRDFRRHMATVEMPFFGQFLGTAAATLFAPDTIAHVLDEESQVDDDYLVVDCSYTFGRDTGDTTTIHMVPTGTEIVL